MKMTQQTVPHPPRPPPAGAKSSGEPQMKTPMADPKIALYRRLNTKFIAMAFILFLLPQILLYFYTSNSASDMLVESLRKSVV